MLKCKCVEVHLSSIRMAQGVADNPALPVELWRHVARFLAMRESCMLASTCRALWAMDLLSLTLCQGECSGEEECAMLDTESYPAPGVGTALHCYCSVRLVVYDARCIAEPPRCERCPSCAVLAWAAKRWSCARVLKIHILQENAKELSQVLRCSNTNDLARLEEVCHLVPLTVPIQARRPFSNHEAAIRQLQVYANTDIDPACAAACSHLLTQASNVQVLLHSAATSTWGEASLHLTQVQADRPALIVQVLFVTSARRMSSFGAARGIKHLILQMPNPQFSRLSPALSVLDQLLTLRLSNNVGFKDQPHTSGALQLSALHSLRSLVLSGVVPTTISCSDSCELHVVLQVGWSMEHPFWDTVMSRLRSVILSGCSPALVALPSILLNAGNLTRATLRVHQCGTATAPLLLGGSLARLEKLILDCVEVHAIVPARVTWRYVHVVAAHLNLQFEDVASFGAAIPAFCFLFNTLQVRYPQPSPYLFMAAAVSPAPKVSVALQRDKRFLKWRLSWQGGSQSGQERCARMALAPDISP